LALVLIPVSIDSIRTSEESLTAYVMFCLLLLTPLAYPGFFPFDVNTILACSAALIFACLQLYRKPFVYVSRKLVLAFVAVALIQLAGFLLGSISAPGSWLLRALEYTSVLVMLTMGASVYAGSLRAWMNIFMAVAVAWSMIGLFVWCGGTGGNALVLGPVTLAMAPAVKLAGPFNQGNIFASMIGMAWIFAHWLYMRERRLVQALAVLFFTAMLFDTLSRGGWIAYTAALSLMLYAMVLPAGQVVLRLIPLWLVGVAIGIGLNSIHVQEQVHAHDLLYTVAKTVETTLAARLVIWATAIVEFLHAPLTGVGWGQFGDAYWHSYAVGQGWVMKHFGAPAFDTFFWSAHNLWLHVLAEGGIVAFALLLWGTWKIAAKSLTLVRNGHSVRLPFAMISLGFLCQSLVNISFTRPLPMLVWAFFVGIAFAPWLRRDGWKLRRTDFSRYASIGIAIVVIAWASRATSQWYMAASWLKHFNLANKQRVEGVVRFAGERAGAIPLIWLGYNVSKENKHLALLTWMLPYLKRDIHEVPFPDTYQLYFYALAVSGKQAEACSVGMLIEKQGYPGESNGAIYRNVCAGKPMPQAYHFGITSH
jgi:O-antigen ligase